MQWNDLIGRRIGPYEIIEELGRGGSARVYRAYQDSMHRYVAMKALIYDSEDRAGFARRFEREVEVVAQLSHPNIVAVYDSGQVEDLIYLVMQCVNGGTLRQRLGQPLPVDEACAAMIQMARALHHAHTRGIVHRDVKPSNMLINAEEDGRLLLTDFGIAKLHGMRGLTKSGTTVGTPEYMAPEQAESGETDARADVYSLGCVLYEALAGRPPFIGTTPVSVLYQQVHARPDYIRGLNPRVPRELARVIELALAKRPDERFPTAESFALALHPFADARERPLASLAPPVPGMPSEPALVAVADAPTAPLKSQRTDDADAHPAAEGADSLAAAGRGHALKDVANEAPAQGGGESGRDAQEPAHDFVARGLGAEGLDALFPDDPEAITARSQQPTTPTRAPALEGGDAPVVEGPDLLDTVDPPPWADLPPADTLPVAPPPAGRAGTSGPRPTIPLTAFRLPSRETTTRPVDLPLTPDGQLDIEALMAQVEQRPAIPMPLPAPTYRDFEGDAGLPGYDPRQMGAPRSRSATRDHTPAELRKALSGALRDYGTAPPLWRPDPDAQRKPPARPERRLLGWLRTRRVIAAIALLAVLAVALIASAILIAGGASLARQEPAPTPAPTASAVPTGTPIPSPSGTATPTQQQILDRQAKAAFRGITLSSSFDNTCASANGRSSFSASESVYVNVCVAKSAPAGQVTIVLRQGGRAIRQLTRDTPVYAGYWYSYYTYGLKPGTYDMLVTYNGGTAADVTFTVS